MNFAKLSVRTGDIKYNIFTLSEHIENNLSEQESAEKNADYFAFISHEYEALYFDELPPNVKNEILKLNGRKYNAASLRPSIQPKLS